jgi:hypothetical protein
MYLELSVVRIIEELLERKIANFVYKTVISGGEDPLQRHSSIRKS